MRILIRLLESFLRPFLIQLLHHLLFADLIKPKGVNRIEFFAKFMNNRRL